MFEEATLREQFQTLLDQQQTAIGIYESASKDFDPETASRIDQLCREKRRHIDLTQRLLEILD